MTIDHVGIVVSSLADSIAQWVELFGYSQSSDIVLNTRQQVRVVFLSKHKSMTIKLVEPSSTRSPVADFARRGGGLHHICFRCDDLDHELPLLQSKGARRIVPPQPGEAFNNRPIAMLLLGDNVLMELIDTDDKASLTSSQRTT